jgi:hypothetical protein
MDNELMFFYIMMGIYASIGVLIALRSLYEVIWLKLNDNIKKDIEND